MDRHNRWRWLQIGWIVVSCFYIQLQFTLCKRRRAFCSSSSYLIMLGQKSVATLGDWKKNKTSFTVFLVITYDFDERTTGIRLFFL
ncbi:hypothetical protein [Bacillus toyonensis]|uniref:hypothetical protein n=1 Tax=Bacillus toyonensis TaxID=155322 RepID=UPI0015CF53AC|nr:hypothetical protein [Bacillus toyonensis]